MKHDVILMGFASPQDGSGLVTFEFASFKGIDFETDPATAKAVDIEMLQRQQNLNTFLRALAPEQKGWWSGQVYDYTPYLPPPVK